MVEDSLWAKPIGYDVRDPNTYGYYCPKCGTKMSDPSFKIPCSKCGYLVGVKELP